MKRILLLDDSPTIQRVVTMSFTQEKGYEVRTASTPVAAQEVLNSFSPNIVVAYIRFMGEPKPELFHGLSERVPAVLLLAESSEPLEGFQKAGFENFLRKPFHTEELKKAIEAVLEKAPTSQVVSSTTDSFSNLESTHGNKKTTEETASAGVETPRPMVPPPPPPLRKGVSTERTSEAHEARTVVPPPPPVKAAQVAEVRNEPSQELEPPKTKVPPPPPRKSNTSFAEFSQNQNETYTPMAESHFTNFSRQPLPENRPATTLDTEALERAYRKSMGTPTPPRPSTPAIGSLSEVTREEIARVVRDVLGKELSHIRQNSTSEIKAEAVKEVQDWLAKEFVGIAKQVLREEIKRLLGSN